MLVADTMVVIHLAKVTLLEASCGYFKSLVIPEAVYQEILAGRKKGYADAILVEELLKAKKCEVMRVREKKHLRRAEQFNVQRGEAEALALYWQEDADQLASDDDNLRKKSILLGIRLIGTPAIMLRLYREKVITQQKLAESLQALRKIGWFSSSVIDKILMEAT